MGQHDLTKEVREFAVEVGAVVYLEETIAEAVQRLRSKNVTNKIVYFYVVDNEQRLKGFVPTRKLLLNDPNSKIADIMEYSVIHLQATQTLNEAMQVFARHRLLAIPVIDDQERLIGAIDVQMYTEESFDVADSRHRRDVFQMLGLSIEDGKKISIKQSYRQRMPWLFCNMFAGLMCAVISRINEGVLGKVLILAMFIPLVLTLSESVSMQSMTQSMQFIRRPKFTWRYSLLKMLREWQIVVMIAGSCGFVVGLLSLFWGDGIMPSIVISLGILFGVSISAGIGIIIPVLLHTLRLDPKVASGPVVLMFADALTTLMYLSLATWWLL